MRGGDARGSIPEDRVFLLTSNPDRTTRDCRYLECMAATVRIPTTMRPITGGEKQVPVEPGTLGEVITELETAHPGLGERLLDEDGALRKFVNVFVDDDDVRYLDGLETAVGDNIVVSIIPAVAGG